MGQPVDTDVTVGEGGETAGETTNGDQNGRQVFVGGVTVAVVGEKGVEELEEEDCS